LKVEYGDRTFIFTGDAEAELEAAILAAGFDISADVLQAAHHGSHTSSTEAFLRAVNPDIAVISVGRGNSYGHPHNAVLERLHRIGARVYRTDTHGNIQINTDGTTLNIKAARRW
jgi:competence protein ComEC